MISMHSQESPLISVVMPVYNGAKYLVDSINSVLSQSFVNFEFIIIDDGSTDHSFQILQSYQQLDKRINLISRENRGLVSTLNEAISVARGIWIARMDQDDIALAHRLERQLEWIQMTGADISGSWVQRFGSSDSRIVKLPQTDEAIKTEMLFTSPFAHPSVMMRTKLISQLKYDQALELAEDYDLWVRAAKVGWKMTNVPEVLLMYRVHAEQITTRTDCLVEKQAKLIRQRYWKFVFENIKINPNILDEALKVFAITPSYVDMDAVEVLLMAIIMNSREESRLIILNHATRIYLKLASNCPDIVSRWDRLNKMCGGEWGGATKFKLFAFRLLRIQAGGSLFKGLKKIYIWATSL